MARSPLVNRDGDRCHPRIENLFSPRELSDWKPGCILEGFRATGCTVKKPMSLSPWLSECHSHWAFRRVQLMCCPQREDWEWRGARLLRGNPRSLERGEIFLDHVLDDLEVESSLTFGLFFLNHSSLDSRAFLKGHNQLLCHITTAFKRDNTFTSFLVGRGWWEEETVLRCFYETFLFVSFCFCSHHLT